MPLALTNVRFRGQSGHDANGPLRRLMTKSGSRGLAGPGGDECQFTGATPSAGFAGPHVRSDVRLWHQGQL